MTTAKTQVPPTHEVGMETPISDLFKTADAEARKASTRVTPSEAACAEELLANGWRPIHASPFWKAPNGELFPGAVYSWQMLKEGTGEVKHCSLCGQRVPE